MDKTEVDVVIVGAGLQGFVLLDQLLKQKKTAIIVTKGKIGEHSQSLHHHGLLHVGHHFGTLEKQVSISKETSAEWVKYFKEQSVYFDSKEQYFALSQENEEKYISIWKKFDLGYEVIPKDKKLSTIDVGENTLCTINGYCFDQDQLLRSFASRLKDYVMKGEILHVSLGDNLAKHIQVKTDHRTMIIETKSVILATGVGTKSLLTTLFPDKHIDTLYKERVLHMIWIKGPKGTLPPSILFPGVVVCVRHQFPDYDLVVLTPPMVEFASKDPTGTDGSSVTYQVNSSFVKSSIDTWLKIFPSMRERVKELKFGAYVGWGAMGPNIPSPYVCQLDFVQNIIVAVPGTLGWTLQTCREVIEILEKHGWSGSGQSNLKGLQECLGWSEVAESESKTLKYHSWEEFSFLHLSK